MKIIPIAEFCGHNRPSNKITTISVERVDDRYYYLTNEGYRSTCYRTLSQAVADITETYGKWYGFKLLKVEG
jgi:hypothetical protein